MNDNGDTIQEPLSPLAPKRIGPNKILGFRTGLAEATLDDGTEIVFDTTIGLGGAAITLAVKMPDGTRVSEGVELKPMMDEWANRLVAELRDATP